MDRRKRWVLLALVVMMLALSSLACGDDTTVDTVVEDTDSLVSEDVESALGIINDANCLLGLDSCVE